MRELLKILNISLLMGAQVAVGLNQQGTADKVIQCLDQSKVPQALPGTEAFNISSRPHNLRLKFTPIAIAIPRTVAHVQAAVACGRKLGIKVNARSGGHNYASHGIGGEDGHLVLDLKYLNDVKVDPRTNIATVGPGARLGNMALALHEQGNRALPHGVCPKVGVGGHVLHGGWGYSTNEHGLFLDKLVEAQVVLADSSVVTASTSQNSDLFWGLRGAGMSFGIATSFKFRTIDPPDEVQLFYFPFVWNSTQAKDGWRVFQDYAASKSTPKELLIRVVIGSARSFTGIPFSGTIFLFEGSYHGPRADYDKFIKPFVDSITPIGGLAGLLGGLQVFTVNYIDSLLYVNNNALLGLVPDPEPLESGIDDQIFINGFIKSLVSDKLNNRTINGLMDTLSNADATNPDRNYLIIVAAIGGPNSYNARVKASSTSYAHRDKLLLWEIGDSVFGESTVYPSAVGIPWVGGIVDQMERSEGEKFGAYYNYADPSLGDHRKAGERYWVDEYDKLVKLKRRFDPFGVFENPQTVGRK